MPGKAHVLTQAEEEACLNIIRGYDPMEAITAAGFKLQENRKDIAGQARDFFRRPLVAARIRELRHIRAMEAIEDSFNVEAEMMALYEYAKAFVDITDVKGEATGEYFMRDLPQARKLVEGIAKLRGLYVERKEVGKPGEFARLDASELHKRLVTEFKAAGVTPKAIESLVGLAPRGRA